VALAEELIFRGAIQGLALRSLGSRPAAVATSSISFAILAMGSLSPLFVLIMLLVGIAFGWTVEVTGSLWGVVGAHAAAVIGLLVVWPALLA
jgi:membrane protease YdiL (CAAX protease family)